MKTTQIIHPAAAVAGALALTSGILSAANLIVNGGFETGDFTGWVGPDPVYNNDEIVGGGAQYAGNYAARFGNEDGINWALQTLPTINGEIYEISFYLRSDSYQPPIYYPSIFQVLVDYVAVPGLGSQYFTEPFPYTQFKGTFTAASNATVLEFQILTLDNFYLDDVAVTVVPEPSAALLGGIGLLGLLRRRRN